MKIFSVNSKSYEAWIVIDDNNEKSRYVYVPPQPLRVHDLWYVCTHYCNLLFVVVWIYYIKLAHIITRAKC